MCINVCVQSSEVKGVTTFCCQRILSQDITLGDTCARRNNMYLEISNMFLSQWLLQGNNVFTCTDQSQDLPETLWSGRFSKWKRKLYSHQDNDQTDIFVRPVYVYIMFAFKRSKCATSSISTHYSRFRFGNFFFFNFYFLVEHKHG